MHVRQKLKKIQTFSTPLRMSWHTVVHIARELSYWGHQKILKDERNLHTTLDVVHTAHW